MGGGPPSVPREVEQCLSNTEEYGCSAAPTYMAKPIPLRPALRVHAVSVVVRVGGHLHDVVLERFAVEERWRRVLGWETGLHHHIEDASKQMDGRHGIDRRRGRGCGKN